MMRRRVAFQRVAGLLVAVTMLVSSLARPMAACSPPRRDGSSPAPRVCGCCGGPNCCCSMANKLPSACCGGKPDKKAPSSPLLFQNEAEEELPDGRSSARCQDCSCHPPTQPGLPRSATDAAERLRKSRAVACVRLDLARLTPAPEARAGVLFRADHLQTGPPLRVWLCCWLI